LKLLEVFWRGTFEWEEIEKFTFTIGFWSLETSWFLNLPFPE
jgi:hypothetical protein